MSSTDSQLKLRYGATDIIFVSLDKKQEKIFDTVWAHYLRSNEKEKNNRYLACCRYCNKIMAGRTSYLRAHITNECVIASSEVRATVFKQSSKIEKPAALAEDMTAVSNRRFEVKPSGKEMKKQKMNSGSSSIMNFMEQKVDTNTSEALHILLLQAIIWGNLSWNFLNNPFFIRFLALLRPSYKLPSGDVFASRIFNSLSAQIIVQNMESINSRLYNGKWHEDCIYIYIYMCVFTNVCV